MATYTELYTLAQNVSLKERVAVACIVAAEAIRGEDAGTGNHANRLVWAKKVMEGPLTEATRMLPVLLAQNKSLSVAAIEGATDTAIQTAVDGAVNLFAV